MKELNKLIEWKNYEIKNIFDDFEIPWFQRKSYSAHVQRILKSMEERKLQNLPPLVNNIIWVSKGINNKWNVLDGQQRLLALNLAGEKGILKTIDLNLRVFDSKDDSNIYRLLNKSKSLTTSDLTKSYDDGTINFFNQLEQFASHYGSKTKLKFWDIIAAYYFYRGKYIRMSQYLISKEIFNIPQEDIDKIKKFLLEMFTAFSLEISGKAYKMIIFRSLIKIFFEDGCFIKKLVEAVKHNKFINALSSSRTIDDINKMYLKMRELQP